MGQKVLIIGLDGATNDIIEPLIASGKLPNFAKFANYGISGRLTSVYPPITSPAWASFLTGMNPGKHGVFDHKRKSKSGVREIPVNATDIKSEPIWRILTRASRACCFLNVPMTYPPEPVKGCVVSGIPCPNGIYTYPPELSLELQGMGYRPYTRTSYYVVDKLTFVDDVFETTAKQAETARYLMQKSEWDLFMVVFMATDWLQHFYWKYMNAEHSHFNSGEAAKYNVIPRIYEFIDPIIGELVTAAGKGTTTFIVSDHGFGPLDKHVYINNWLMDLGLLKLRRNNGLRDLARRVMLSTGLTAEKLMNLYMRFAPAGIKKLVPEALFDDVNAFMSRLPIAPYLTLEEVDWSGTKAYAHGHIGQIWINVKERDASGIVGSQDYESLRGFIARKLRELVDPQTGEKVVTDVFKREDVYSGPYASDGPDLLFVMKDMRYLAWEGINFAGDYFFDPDNLASGSHRMDGVLFVAGNGVKRGMKLSASITDVVPTVLHLLNIPIPSNVDGHCLTEILEPASEAGGRVPQYENPREPKEVVFEWSPEDEEAVKDRLRNLGYMA